MKRWIETLLGLAIVGAWAGVALTASDATRRETAAVVVPGAAVVVEPREAPSPGQG